MPPAFTGFAETPHCRRWRGRGPVDITFRRRREELAQQYYQLAGGAKRHQAARLPRFRNEPTAFAGSGLACTHLAEVFAERARLLDK
jgi:hypothetical protein